MDFDRIQTHPILLKTLTDFDGSWPIKRSIRNQDLCKQKHIYRQKVTWDKNFDRVNGITFDKVFIEQVFRQKLLPSFWLKTLIV
jgi:hypothetical protein